MKLSISITTLLIAASSQAQICNGCRIQNDTTQKTEVDSTTLYIRSGRGRQEPKTYFFGPAGEKIEVQKETPKLKCGRCGRG